MFSHNGTLLGKGVAELGGDRLSPLGPCRPDSSVTDFCRPKCRRQGFTVGVAAVAKGEKGQPPGIELTPRAGVKWR